MKDKHYIRIIFPDNLDTSEKNTSLRIYSILTDHFREKPGSFSNYIDAPKENGYESLHVKLLNVARSSIQELREDYRDYLLSRNLIIWTPTHSRYDSMQTFCKKHNTVEDYQPYFAKWNAEEMANIALTLCYMTDAMLNHHLIAIEKEFVEQGGIKERMHAARTGYRKEQDADYR